ncbi:MAG: hypothetical protein RL417_1960 [Pseudomonadota bacterium]|jgi:CYTH domain-containing protein
MGLEIERRFLLEALPALSFQRVFEVEQGYLLFGEDGGEVRVRRADGAHTLTVKRGGGLARGETEIVLSAQQFEALWSETAGRRLSKRRHVAVLHGVTMEIDRYSGGLTQLILVEVEFETIEASAAFIPPDWFGREVTEDLRFRNKNLVDLLPEALNSLLASM